MNPPANSNLTMVEGIFSRKLNSKIQAGDRIEFLPDQILANEMLGAVVIPKMKEIGVESYFEEMKNVPRYRRA